LLKRHVTEFNWPSTIASDVEFTNERFVGLRPISENHTWLRNSPLRRKEWTSAQRSTYLRTILPVVWRYQLLSVAFQVTWRANVLCRTQGRVQILDGINSTLQTFERITRWRSYPRVVAFCERDKEGAPFIGGAPCRSEERKVVEQNHEEPRPL